MNVNFFTDYLPFEYIFFEPGCNTAIDLLLRRTLVLLVIFLLRKNPGK